MFRLSRGGLNSHSYMNPKSFRFRFYSVSKASNDAGHVIKPNLEANIFSRSSPRDKNHYQSLPVDTYPNPLFGMGKEELIQLNHEDVKHLLKIPYKTISEADKLCINVTTIINENILQNPRLVKKLMTSLNNSDISQSIVEALRNSYKDDKIKRSVLEYLIDHTSSQFRQDFFGNVSAILNICDKDLTSKTNILMNYLSVLSSLDVVNEKPIIIKSKLYSKIMKITPKPRYGDLYHFFVSLNLQPEKRSDLLKLRRMLFLGSNLEKFVARTGWKASKWHNIEQTSFGESHEARMCCFFLFEDFKEFVLFFIKKRDIINANFYLRLIVTKFETEIEDMSSVLVGSDKKAIEMSNDLNTILNVLTVHIMEFKSPESGLKVFEYMLQNRFEIDFETILTMIGILRNRGLFSEALNIVNSTTTKNITNKQKLLLTNQILELIKAKYSESPKILIGYIVSFFEEGKKPNKVLELLNDLSLLRITHGDGRCGLVHSFSGIQKANIEDSLREQELTHEALTKLYETILNSHDDSEALPDLILDMYESYMKCIQTRKYDVLQGRNLNDHIVTLFMKHLIKRDPSSNQMDLTSSEIHYSTAKRIISDFLPKVRLSRGNSTVYLYDLLIYASLTVWGDYKFASWTIRRSQALGLPFSFNQIYPFIMYHYSRGEHNEAKLWFTEIVKNGVKATAPPNKELFRIARELKWDVTGSSYRKHRSLRNQQEKKELFKLNMDPITFMKDNARNPRVFGTPTINNPELKTPLVEELQTVL